MNIILPLTGYVAQGIWCPQCPRSYKQHLRDDFCKLCLPISWQCNVQMCPFKKLQYLICLMPDVFTLQWQSTARKWVNKLMTLILPISQCLLLTHVAGSDPTGPLLTHRLEGHVSPSPLTGSSNWQFCPPPPPWDYSMYSNSELIVYLAINLFAKNFNSTMVDLVP